MILQDYAKQINDLYYDRVEFGGSTANELIAALIPGSADLLNIRSDLDQEMYLDDGDRFGVYKTPSGTWITITDFGKPRALVDQIRLWKLLYADHDMNQYNWVEANPINAIANVPWLSDNDRELIITQANVDPADARGFYGNAYVVNEYDLEIPITLKRAGDISSGQYMYCPPDWCFNFWRRRYGSISLSTRMKKYNLIV